MYWWVFITFFSIPFYMSETFHNEKKFSSRNGLSMFNKSWGRVNRWAPLISVRDALYKLVVRHSADSKFIGEPFHLKTWWPSSFSQIFAVSTSNIHFSSTFKTFSSKSLNIAIFTGRGERTYFYWVPTACSWNHNCTWSSSRAFVPHQIQYS